MDREQYNQISRGLIREGTTLKRVILDNYHEIRNELPELATQLMRLYDRQPPDMNQYGAIENRRTGNFDNIPLAKQNKNRLENVQQYTAWLSHLENDTLNLLTRVADALVQSEMDEPLEDVRGQIAESSMMEAEDLLSKQGYGRRKRY